MGLTEEIGGTAAQNQARAWLLQEQQFHNNGNRWEVSMLGFQPTPHHHDQHHDQLIDHQNLC